MCQLNTLQSAWCSDHIHISVEDVNEFSPEWQDQKTYVAEVTEGLVEKHILQLDAADADGSEKFSKICRYHLLSPDVPFDISAEGRTLSGTRGWIFADKNLFLLLKRFKLV